MKLDRSIIPFTKKKEKPEQDQSGEQTEENSASEENSLTEKVSSSLLSLKTKYDEKIDTLLQLEAATSGYHADRTMYTLEKPVWKSHILLIFTTLVLFIGLIWAHFAILDEVTRGDGTVIPSSQIQVIQNLEGGIISQIRVKVGQIVEPKQILMKIDDTRFSSTYDESIAKSDALKIKILQLESEVENKPLVYDADFVKKYPKRIQESMLLHQNRLDQYTQLKNSADSAEEQLKMMQPLLKDGAVSPVEVLQQKSQVADFKGKAIQFKAETLSQLTAAKSDYDAIDKSNEADKDRLDRTVVRSPVKGVVKQIKINTIGGVVQPGENLLEIVPLEDTLLIEAKVKPQDIGFLHPDQKAMVKITAYDFAIYGGLPGTVEQISADTLSDEKDEPYYLIRVRTNKNYLIANNKRLNIIPGMHATVDILTGKKSVLAYLLKPILRAKSDALRER